MTDVERKKVLKTLDNCVHDSGNCRVCPYHVHTACKHFLMKDAADVIEELMEENKQPRDELVRCKDCAKAKDFSEQFPDKPFHCVACNEWHNGDWYCADAERRC